MKRLGIFFSFFIVITVIITGFNSLFASEEAFHGGDIIYTKPLKAVLFSHKVHVEEIGFSCEACHDGIFEMSALSVQEKDDFTMDSLYKGKYCGACHDGSMAFASNTQCARCHIGVKGYKRLSQPEAESQTQGED
jgi:c(7)-type cytochrome triheme protein